jgi:Uracil DNA glycosylase superfamily
MTAPTSLVHALSKIELDHVFNPYLRRCDLHDRHDAPARRRSNLEAALTAAVKQQVRTVWIARDLGYRGGRRTGLPLTDEVHLDSFNALYNGIGLRKATKGPAMAERTAAIIWQMLRRIAQPVFFWNVFPLHPHEPGEPMSNRCHTARERQVCERFLYEVLDLLQPTAVIAVGGDAHRAMDCLGIECLYVRHPSYGGQSTFIRQIEAAYDLSPAEPDDPDLFTQPS